MRTGCRSDCLSFLAALRLRLAPEASQHPVAFALIVAVDFVPLASFDQPIVACRQLVVASFEPDLASGLMMP